ncbi:hypothetical protein NPIRD3C_1872 [Nitrosopumilus piranensis]|uniref:Uncharacterized protein n=1 Tax=Nitrosopumilus piranensis TaxID=1582439 RepID=A0A0C5CD19_9ARCH|nr:hypothetical protein NPIRD3C_1872 [Nitrosopumilus piranensis]
MNFIVYKQEATLGIMLKNLFARLKIKQESVNDVNVISMLSNEKQVDRCK